MEHKDIKVVRVEWIDSASDTGRWTLIEDIDNNVLNVISQGFLVKKDEKQITLALNYIADPEQYCQMICIPKVAITKYEEL